jgi:hypothetical protein
MNLQNTELMQWIRLLPEADSKTSITVCLRCGDAGFDVVECPCSEDR